MYHNNTNVAGLLSWQRSLSLEHLGYLCNSASSQVILQDCEVGNAVSLKHLGYLCNSASFQVISVAVRPQIDQMEMHGMRMV